MSTDAGAAPVCYRHPDRPSYVKCQRCGRTICPSCQTPAAVGVQCPECVREGGAQVRRPKPAIVTAFAKGSSVPVVTYGIMLLCALVFGLQWLPDGFVTYLLVYYAPLTWVEPWRLITSAFAHSTTWLPHIALNLISLYFIGPILERGIGRLRFLALYLVSAVGASVAVLLIAPDSVVLGASGAIFGLLGAFFVLQRGLGGNTTPLLILIVVNLALGFVPGTNVSWQGHVGGLITGAAIGLVLLRTRNSYRRPWLPWVLISAVVTVLAVLIVVGMALLPLR